MLLINRSMTVHRVRNDLARWHEPTDRPILISDMLYLVPTELGRVGEKAPSSVPDQMARGEAYVTLAKATHSEPYTVGLHWFAFIENRTRKSGPRNYLD